MSCWKCGNACEGTECPHCTGGGDVSNLFQGDCPPMDLQQMNARFMEERRRIHQEWMASSAELDWDKIVSAEDVRIFMFAIYGRHFAVVQGWDVMKEFLQVLIPRGARVSKKHSQWHTLKKYCRLAPEPPL